MNTFTCPVCSLSIQSNVSEYTKHIRGHNIGGKCCICQKEVSSASSLDRHMVIHSGERPYGCTICSMTFTTNGNLHRHFKVHEVGDLQVSRGRKRRRSKVNDIDSVDYKSMHKNVIDGDQILSLLQSVPMQSESSILNNNALLDQTLFANINSQLLSSMINILQKPTLNHQIDLNSLANKFEDEKSETGLHFDFNESKIPSSEKETIAKSCSFSDSQSNSSYSHDLSLAYSSKNNQSKKSVISPDSFDECKWLECDKCAFQCLNKSSLFRHSRVHTGFRPFRYFRCKICTHPFETLAACERHILKKHKIQDLSKDELLEISSPDKFTSETNVSDQSLTNNLMINESIDRAKNSKRLRSSRFFPINALSNFVKFNDKSAKSDDEYYKAGNDENCLLKQHLQKLKSIVNSNSNDDQFDCSEQFAENNQQEHQQQSTLSLFDLLCQQNLTESTFEPIDLNSNFTKSDEEIESSSINMDQSKETSLMNDLIPILNYLSDK